MYFSIITGSKNTAQFLPKNLKSVTRQTYNDYEHIIIDGHSTDGSVKLIKTYIRSNPGKVKYYSLPPKGISNAFNEGVNRASGRYLLFLNSDDYLYDNDTLKEVQSFLSHNVNLDWIYGKINVIESNGKKIGIFPERKVFQLANATLLKYVNYIPHQAVFIKRSIFSKFGLYDENISSKMDYEYWLRITKKTKWKFYNNIISNYTIRKGSQTASIKNVEENRLNLDKVRSKYLNVTDKFIAAKFDYLLRKYHKTLR